MFNPKGKSNHTLTSSSVLNNHKGLPNFTFNKLMHKTFPKRKKKEKKNGVHILLGGFIFQFAQQHMVRVAHSAPIIKNFQTLL